MNAADRVRAVRVEVAWRRYYMLDLHSPDPAALTPFRTFEAGWDAGYAKAREEAGMKCPECGGLLSPQLGVIIHNAGCVGGAQTDVDLNGWAAFTKPTVT